MYKICILYETKDKRLISSTEKKMELNERQEVIKMRARWDKIEYWQNENYSIIWNLLEIVSWHYRKSAK